MANNEQQTIQIKAVLDKSGIQADLEPVQKIVDKYPLKISPELDKAELQKHMQDIVKQMASEFNKTFQANLSSSDIFKALNKETEKSSSFFSDVLNKMKENFVSKIADIGERVQGHTFQNIVKLF